MTGFDQRTGIRYSMAKSILRVVRSALFAVMLPAAAQAATGDTLTLQAAIEAAQARSPSLEAAEVGVRAADAGVDEAHARPDPVLSYEAENVAGSGPYAGVERRETTTTVQLPIELGGKRAARVRVADAERDSATAGVQVTAADLALRTTEAFIAVVASARRLEAAEARVGFTKQAFEAAELRVTSGKASPIEAQRANVQLITARVETDQAQRNQVLAAEQLASLTGLPAATPLAADWFDETDATPVGSAAPGPDLAALDATVAIARARLDVAQRGRIPDVTVMAGSRRFAETNDTATVVGVSLPVPLFSRGSATATRAQAQLEQSEFERAAALMAIEQAIGQAQAEVLNARAAAAAAAGPTSAAASEAARIARIGYAEGKFSQLDLLDAERSWAETRRDAIDALAAFHGARARLARLLGRTEPLEKD